MSRMLREPDSGGIQLGTDTWRETRQLPEFDLITPRDASPSTGDALQTHLFHDRIMRMDEIDLGVNSTLGPNSGVVDACSVSDELVLRHLGDYD
ncbi:hypothetical protein [Arthrobacter sp. MMS24-S77]